MDKKSANTRFYELDRTKPYRALHGDDSRIILLIVAILFPVVFIGGNIALLIVFRDKVNNAESIVVSTAGFLAGIIFGIVFGRNSYSALKRARREKRIIRDCELTSGKIIEAKFESHTHRGSNSAGSTTSYEVHLIYLFYDKARVRRTAKADFWLSTRPEFRKGQNVMVAFTKSDSVIMERYTLLGESETRFQEKEQENQAQIHFRGLSKDTFELGKEKPRSAEQYQACFYIALGFFVVFLIIGGVILGVAVLGGGSPVPGLIFFGVCLATFAPPVLGFSIAGLERFIRFHKILRGRHFFTYGNVRPSVETGTGRKAIYCYMDKFGAKHTKKNKCFTLSTLDGCRKMRVMYDLDGRSVLLRNKKMSKLDFQREQTAENRE